MQSSHSRIELFEGCPFRYKLRYCDKILTLAPDNADNALLLGQALHTGLEKGVDTAISEYFMAFPVIDDNHVNEAIKLEYLIPLAKAVIPEGHHEVQITNEHFIGFIDLLVPIDGKTFDLYDFKYSNNGAKYKDSRQLHLYKYFWEKQNPGKKIRNLFFLFVPKVNIKQKKTEDLFQYRQRIQGELKQCEPKLLQIEYKPEKVIEFMLQVKKALEATDFPKVEGWLCNYCEYQDYCQKEIDYMLLPKNERRNIEKIEKKVVWLYGAPFSGKTTFANCFPDPLMLNTDGNIKFVDAPFLPIRDEVKVEGRMTKRTLAWQVFKDAIAELEKKDNDFKTIIVDLLEDCYEHCRLFMYDQMGITHESDDSFRAWDKVRVEFLSTLKKLMNLEYENIILISHMDTSKDITKKGGDKITAIKPNLQEKTANKVAGMVDIVARVVADGDIHTLSFKTNEVIFGGGRLKSSTTEIQLDYSAFLTVYEEANRNAVANLKGEQSASTAATEGNSGRRSSRGAKKETPPTPDPKPETETEPKVEPETQTTAEPEPETKTSADTGADAEPKAEPSPGEVKADEPKPAAPVKTRKRRDA